MKSKKLYSFPKHYRLCKKKDWQRVFQKGKVVKNHQIKILYLPQGLPYNRVGIAVGRKFGKAVKRNRAKRLLREAYRLVQPSLPTGYDLLLFPRFSAQAIPHLEELKKSILQLFQRVKDESTS